MGNVLLPQNVFVNSSGVPINANIYSAGGVVQLETIGIHNGEGTTIIGPTCIIFTALNKIPLEITNINGGIVSSDASQCYSPPGQGQTYIIRAKRNIK